MLASEEAAFEVKAEAMLRGQRELPCGRDFRWNKDKNPGELTEGFEKRYHDTFPGSPGTPEWWKKRFGKRTS